MSRLNQEQHRFYPAATWLLAKSVPWLIFSGLMYLVSLYSYLLFHSLAELFSICVAVAVFMLVWNTQRFMKDDFLFFISTSYLFTGFIDLFHTLSYKGVGVIYAPDANLPTQFWIAARYLQSLSFLAAVLLIKRRLNHRFLMGSMATITLLLLTAIFMGWFPDCYVNGLTPFKRISEYIIALIFAAAGLRLARGSEALHPQVLTLIRVSIVFTILAELAFTFYVDVYGLFNFLGHIFKIIAVYCIYKAVIETGLNQPVDLLFHGMKRRELELERHHKLLEELAHRDQLTGLPNRLLFETRLAHALEKAQRENYADQKKIVQIMIMDVDNFKSINDRIGHLGGDQVLQEIGRRLKSQVRESDTVARWGGDEFTCILEDVASHESAEHMARKILAAMLDPVYVQGQELTITISLGYSLFPLHSEEKERLVHYADVALYSAKETKRSFRAYDKSMSGSNGPIR